jgi:WD40 repeat protein
MASHIGQQFGQYTIAATLGSSGMMTLYRARQVSTGRDVVIKVIKPENSAPIERFMRETQKAASLDHPHILKVLDFGMRDGSLYVVMEVKAGGSLATRLKAQGKLDADAVARCLEQISKALDYAYSHGMVYRALKPQNVLLDEDGNAFLTNTAHPLAADQQRERDAARSDILALAAMTYELLTGTLPSTSGALPRLRQTRPDLPQSLEEIVFRGMAKRPEAQFQSAAEFARAFREALADLTPKDTDLVAAQRSPTLLESAKAKATAFMAQQSSSLRVGLFLVGALALVVTLINTILVFLLINRLSNPETVLAALTAAETAPAAPIAVTRIPDASIGRVTELQTFGHKGEVFSVVWSPDGRYVASGATDNTVRVWEAATGQPVRTLREHTDRVTSIAWSPDGRYIASGAADKDKTVRLWEAATGQLVRTLRGHTGGIFSVAWSPDARYIASSAGDKTVQVWETATGQTVQTLREHTGSILSVTWSPDGRYIASGADDVRLWEVATGQLVQTLSCIRKVSWSPDGRYLACLDYDYGSEVILFVRVYDAMTGDVLRNLIGHAGTIIFSLTWSPDGRYLASCSDDKTVRVWEAPTGRLVRTLTGHASWVRAVAWSPDGRYLASGSSDNTVRIWGVP